MVDKNRSDSTGKNKELHSGNNILNKLQIFLDNNIRIITHAAWIIGGIGVVIIIRRTYALHHFTKQSSIPEIYFRNNATLSGKVVKIHSNGSLGVLHLPLLWRARINYISDPDSSLLNVSVTGVELQNGGVEHLSTQLANQSIKFQLLGKNECDYIESIIYRNKETFFSQPKSRLRIKTSVWKHFLFLGKGISFLYHNAKTSQVTLKSSSVFKGWLRRKSCINEEIISRGVATVKHVPTLSHVNAYNQLIERLVKAEIKAVKKKSGIWKDDINDGLFHRIWSWLKNKVFRR